MRVKTARSWGFTALFLAGLLAVATPVVAADALAESSQLQKCLKRADDLPDIAAAEAAVWIKKGGGDEAHLCRAFAQANRGMHVDAAREFWGLAALLDKSNTSRAVTLHNFAGQEFLRAKDSKNALAQFAASLKMVPTHADALIGHAEALMLAERYWDALDDLNHVLKSDPQNLVALRQRGRAWTQLGNDQNAQEDFEHAEALNPSAASEASKP